MIKKKKVSGCQKCSSGAQGAWECCKPGGKGDAEPVRGQS